MQFPTYTAVEIVAPRQNIMTIEKILAIILQDPATLILIKPEKIRTNSLPDHSKKSISAAGIINFI